MSPKWKWLQCCNLVKLVDTAPGWKNGVRSSKFWLCWIFCWMFTNSIVHAVVFNSLQGPLPNNFYTIEMYRTYERTEMIAVRNFAFTAWTKVKESLDEMLWYRQHVLPSLWVQWICRSDDLPDLLSDLKWHFKDLDNFCLFWGGKVLWRHCVWQLSPEI